MRGGRLMLIAGLIVLLGVLAVGVYILLGQGEVAAPPAAEGEPLATPTPATEPIVVAAQDIPRGMRLTEAMVEDGALTVSRWSPGAAPDNAVRSLEYAYGRMAKVDIVRGTPILEGMLTDLPGEFGAAGSDAALYIPENRVAYALPVARYSSVAWALQPGDHVDIILSLLMVDLDEEFQSSPPNQYTCVSPADGEECQSGTLGRLESLPVGWIVNVTPAEEQRPRLVTQLTIQNAAVLQVGDWADARPQAPPPSPDTDDEEEAEAGAAEPQQVTLPPVRPVTLAVTRQEAIALDYAQAIGARINFVLRRAGDEATSSTQSVTLDYLMQQYDIELPPKLPHGVTPPLSELERIPRTDSAGRYGSTEEPPQPVEEAD